MNYKIRTKVRRLIRLYTKYACLNEGGEGPGVSGGVSVAHLYLQEVTWRQRNVVVIVYYGMWKMWKTGG